MVATSAVSDNFGWLEGLRIPKCDKVDLRHRNVKGVGSGVHMMMSSCL